MRHSRMFSYFWPYRCTRLTRWRTCGNACAATTPGTLGALALPMATHDSAVHFTLFAASGMIGNQRLEHSGEPRGKSFGSDTLGGNAGALMTGGCGFCTG